MSQRTERVAAEIQAVLGECLARGEIKDPRVQDSGLVTVTHVRPSGDLRQARVFFTVHGADEASLKRVRQGLESAGGYLRKNLGQRLRMKVTPSLTFEADRVFEQASKIEALLREVAAVVPGEATAGEATAGEATARKSERGQDD